VLACPNSGEWCRVEISGIKGWMRRSEMWGVYREEVID
jgi:SH3-like domain-containing protein